MATANIHDPERLTGWLNDESDVIPYFRWISENRYRPAFRVGGSVESDYSTQSDRWADCEGQVKAASAGGADGALIIDTSSSVEGLAESGEWCSAEDCGSFPGNDRWAIVGGDAYADSYVHEIGHALHWPHSFSQGSSWEYDNPMDVMGSPTNDGKREWVATPAVNRYAAGWIDPDDVATWHGEKGVAKFRIDPIGVHTPGGKQMVALTYKDDGVFDMLGARVRGGYDLDIPKEGVEVYRVDQRPGACDNELACISTNRRVQQRGAADATDHVLAPGESLSIPIVNSDGTKGSRVVSVKRRVGDSFDVVLGPPFSGTFRDDDESVHEASIEALAQESITRGCDTVLDFFCPNRTVTRAQLAVMMVRATEGDTALPAATGNVYSDVAAEAWFAAHVERFATRAWTNPQGVFHPDDPATRADVAEFIARLVPTVTMAPEATGRFTDVAADHPYILAIEGLAAADVTKGCATDPPRFCPNRTVTRAQLASLLVRAFGATDTDTENPDQARIAAGDGYHSCAIRTDRTVDCWGNNRWWNNNGGQDVTGQADPPPGQYTAVAAGAAHSCGLRTDRTIHCWGQNDSRQTDSPAGEYTAVTAGHLYSCAIRTFRTIVCWGKSDDPPLGQYTAIAAGGFHSCAIRTDRTIVCWGDNYHGQTDSPAGQYTAVAAGNAHSCGLRTDQIIVCWGRNDYGQADAPPGQYTAVAVGDAHTCGLRTDRTIHCWGRNDYGQTDAPAGEYTAVATGRVHSCGLRTDRTIVCWGNNLFGQADSPPGEYGEPPA